MQTKTPTPKHIEYLRTNPDTAHFFDEVYGEGAASQFLPQTTPEDLSGVSKEELLSSLPSSNPDDVLANSGSAQFTNAIARGVGEAANETVKTLKSVDTSISELNSP